MVRRGPDRRLEASPRRSSDRLLDEGRDTATPKGADGDDRPPGESDPRLDNPLRHEMGRDLHRGDEVARLDDEAVENGKDLEGVEPIEPFEGPGPDPDDARLGGPEVDPALDRPGEGDPGSGNGDGEHDRRAGALEEQA
ncbi:MAG: hypothetical protein C4343_07570 [Chloroflexota bacterium]